MDTRKLIEVFRGTLNSAQREEAEGQITQMKKIIGFGPTLLQMVMMSDVDMPVRQAGVIYLKSLITQHWSDKGAIGDANNPMNFIFHEQDRSMIRDSIVDAIVHAPELIQVQLAVCIHTMVKHDFPERWTQIVDKISIYLQNPESAGWGGALLCLYQLVKNFEYRKAQERGPLNDAMNLLLPLINELCIRLLPDDSEQSVALQKQILKIYFALTQYVLPLNLITREMFAQWMEILRQIIDRPVPEQTLLIDEDERPDLPWWKCKKWALHIIHRMFERYGCPGSVEKEYKEFAEWFLKTFSCGILEVLLKILAQYTRKIYIPPRVVQLSLNYITLAVNHAHSWKFLKEHMFPIIQDVIFPLLSYSQTDEELWESDPQEYIRVKFDIFEDFVSPVNAAASLLIASCKKRKNMLERTMQLILEVLNSDTGPRQRDGALHMVGTLASILFKKKPYKEQMEQMIVRYVYPEFQSPYGHMRARACWVIHSCDELKFRSDENLATAVTFVTNALLTDRDLPVKVEAAIAIQMLLSEQEKVETILRPQVNMLALELLNLIRETENDELSSVLQKFVTTYPEEIAKIAVEMCQHLAQSFKIVVDTDEGSDEKAITAMGLLNTIESIISMLEDYPAILAHVQSTVLFVVGHIFTGNLMEFYEEAMSLVYDLTTKSISEDMWKVFEHMYRVFEENGLDYFTDMMPALHNYVTVDTPAFLSNQDRLLAMYKMCKAVLTADTGEDPECHAAKLLEVIILQCKGQIDQCISPFIELVLERLTKEVKTSELRAMCLQVVIAALYYNPELWLKTMGEIQLSVSPGVSISEQFITQWIHDADCFLGLHDRKLCVLGLSTLMAMGSKGPLAVNDCAPRIIPCLILVFEGLKQAYAAKAQENQEEESEQEGSEDEEILSSDEDEVLPSYLESLNNKVNKGKNSMVFSVSASMQDGNDDDDDDDDDEDDEDYEVDDTGLEAYTTPLDEEDTEIDEYVVFKEVLQTLEGADPLWYNALTSNLTPEQRNALVEVLVLADQRKAAAESKKIEQRGGYNFVTQTVPTSFNFGGKPLGR
ncbi:importin-7 isoform X2 [Cimex lectularius]|uniref:Importin N-terminal domain-containing protein n=1 Tax=Cimex lectularius TaxID=79782 RepID=A0A8I6TLF8_CIMLE|nr:importin-7 isoform X2 [Cimex lectularius]